MKKTHQTIPKKTNLRFSPTAWAKLLYLRDAGDTEIGGFGITPADDLLYVDDIGIVKQVCSWAHVEFDDQAVADFFDDQVDAGRKPEQFARIWIHTHPGDSPQPSGTDEATFSRVFSGANWAMMVIVARGNQTYARLRFNIGPGGEVLVPVDVDYSRPFAASDHKHWQDEYSANVSSPPPEPAKQPAALENLGRAGHDDEFVDAWWRNAWGDYADFDQLPVEKPYAYVRDF